MVPAAKDGEDLLERFERAATGGFSFAYHCLGEALVEGNGVDADVKKGVQWLKKGAELNEAGCFAEFGKCYRDGLGVEADNQQALSHWERAMELGAGAPIDNYNELKAKLES